MQPHIYRFSSEEEADVKMEVGQDAKKINGRLGEIAFAAYCDEEYQDESAWTWKNEDGEQFRKYDFSVMWMHVDVKARQSIRDFHPHQLFDLTQDEPVTSKDQPDADAWVYVLLENREYATILGWVNPSEIFYGLDQDSIDPMESHRDLWNLPVRDIRTLSDYRGQGTAPPWLD